MFQECIVDLRATGTWLTYQKKKLSKGVIDYLRHDSVVPTEAHIAQQPRQLLLDQAIQRWEKNEMNLKYLEFQFNIKKNRRGRTFAHEAQGEEEGERADKRVDVHLHLRGQVYQRQR
jgi:hypothetical protein